MKACHQPLLEKAKLGWELVTGKIKSLTISFVVTKLETDFAFPLSKFPLLIFATLVVDCHSSFYKLEDIQSKYDLMFGSIYNFKLLRGLEVVFRNTLKITIQKYN